MRISGEAVAAEGAWQGGTAGASGEAGAASLLANSEAVHARRRGSCFPTDRTLVSRGKKYEASIRKGEQGVHDVGTRRRSERKKTSDRPSQRQAAA